MTPHHPLQFALWIVVAYLAAVLQTAFGTVGPGPQWLLAVAAAWLTAHPGPRGVLGVAIIGCLLDALGASRLGLHLGICGLLAALAVMILSTIPRRWHLPLVAAWLTFGDAVASGAILSLTSLSTWSSAVIRDAVTSAAWTAGLVAGVALSIALMQRCLNSGLTGPTVRLGNRWHRLIE